MGMNKETGIVTRQFSVVGMSFEIIKNRYGFVLFYGTNTITIYHKSERKRKEIVLQDEFNQCNAKFLSESNVIGFNHINQSIILK
jgi:hypothetical protein